MNNEISLPDVDTGRLEAYASRFETLDLRQLAIELREFFYTDPVLNPLELDMFKAVMAERFKREGLNVEDFVFSKQVIDKFMEFRTYMRTRDAARLAGMSPRRFRAALFGFGFPAESIYKTFLEMEANAELVVKSRLMQVVYGEAASNARMALAVLERKYPKEWGNPKEQQSSVVVNNVVDNHAARAAKNAARLRELREARKRNARNQ